MTDPDPVSVPYLLALTMLTVLVSSVLIYFLGHDLVLALVGETVVCVLRDVALQWRMALKQPPERGEGTDDSPTSH